MTRLLAYLPRGNTLDDRAWHKRHVFLQVLLLLHLLVLYVFGIYMGRSARETLLVLSIPAACLVLGHLIQHRRTASVLITAGLTYGSAVLVSFSNGSIEAHFHFFIMIGFIALYQDWVPFLWNVVFTVLSHGFGSALRTDLIFNHPAGQTSPWVWSAIHGVAVLAACCGVVIFWETTEREQRKTLTLTKQLADAEITRRRFTSDLLVNLARRNQSLLYRQLGLINQLEDQEQDPDALADLFRLDHLATRIRRNAESLLVLSGEEPPRTWGRPVPLVDVVRAAIAETEDLDRVVFAVDERLAVSGNAVADLTHLMAELVENAVHFSPPEASVIIRTRPYLQAPGGARAHGRGLGRGHAGRGHGRRQRGAGRPPGGRPVGVPAARAARGRPARPAPRHRGVAHPDSRQRRDRGRGPPGVAVLRHRRHARRAVRRRGRGPVPGGPGHPGGRGHVRRRPPAAPGPGPRSRRAGRRPSAGSTSPRSRPATATGTGDGDGDGDGNGNGHGADWSGWWEPSPDDLGGAEPLLSPLAARPPLSERVQASGAWEPHPPGAGAPEREGSRPPEGVPTAVHSPQTRDPLRPAPVAADDAGLEGPLLSRRVPQAHLAPELRRHGREGATAGPDGALPDAAEARAALSRYQASRQAAKAAVDDGRAGEAGPEPPPAGGGWS